MKCADCGGLVTWRGPLTDLTHTECERCGHRNCQEVELDPDDEDEAEWEHPCPYRGEPTKTPAGESCSACGLRGSHINDSASGVEVPDARPTVEQVLSCADAYGDARIMASKGRVERSEVDEARNELRELVSRALGVAGDVKGPNHE